MEENNRPQLSEEEKKELEMLLEGIPREENGNLTVDAFLAFAEKAGKYYRKKLEELEDEYIVDDLEEEKIPEETTSSDSQPSSDEDLPF